ncbi:MAG: hypothetical protein K2I83_05305 [Bacteroidales bacterium]|nr:hypothetical protein [Bacteroidales bacterium]
MKETAPYAVAALVLGICSLLFACVFAGFVCAIIGLVLANKGLRYYREQPDLYGGYGMLKAGKVTSIIGIVLGAFWIVWAVLVVLLITAGIFTLPFLFLLEL